MPLTDEEKSMNGTAPKRKSRSIAKTSPDSDKAIVRSELETVARELALRQRVRETALSRFYDQKYNQQQQDIDSEPIEIEDSYFSELFEEQFSELFGESAQLAGGL